MCNIHVNIFFVPFTLLCPLWQSSVRWCREAATLLLPLGLLVLGFLFLELNTSLVMVLLTPWLAVVLLLGLGWTHSWLGLLHLLSYLVIQKVSVCSC